MTLIGQTLTWAIVGLAVVVMFGCSGSSSDDPPVVVQPALVSPVRLAMSTDGDLWTADHLANRIFRVSSDDLEVVSSFPASSQPAGILSTGDRLIVAEQSSGSVAVYSQAGELLFRFGQGPGEFSRPNGLALNEADKLVYVVDLQAAEIRVFTLGGLDAGFSIGAAELNYPTAVTYDPVRREVLVSDFGTPDVAQVRVFTPDGTFLRSLPGRTGGGMLGGSNTFSAPQGLIADGAGHLFLVDSLLGEVLVLDQQTGALLKSLGRMGGGPGDLYLPLDVTLDPVSGDVFVANNKHARVEVFREGGLLP